VVECIEASQSPAPDISPSLRSARTTRTPWSRAVPQGASKTPPAYSWKLRSSASMATLTGWFATACGGGVVQGLSTRRGRAKGPGSAAIFQAGCKPRRINDDC